MSINTVGPSPAASAAHGEIGCKGGLAGATLLACENDYVHFGFPSRTNTCFRAYQKARKNASRHYRLSCFHPFVLSCFLTACESFESVVLFTFSVAWVNARPARDGRGEGRDATHARAHGGIWRLQEGGQRGGCLTRIPDRHGAGSAGSCDSPIKDSGPDGGAPAAQFSVPGQGAGIFDAAKHLTIRPKNIPYEHIPPVTSVAGRRAAFGRLLHVKRWLFPHQRLHRWVQFLLRSAPSYPLPMGESPEKLCQLLLPKNTITQIK